LAGQGNGRAKHVCGSRPWFAHFATAWFGKRLTETAPPDPPASWGSRRCRAQFASRSVIVLMEETCERLESTVAAA